EFRRVLFRSEVKRRILLGTYALSAGYYDAFYGKAQQVRTKLIQEFRSAYERADVLVSPTSPTVAFELGPRVEDPLAMYLSDICTRPCNLTGDPAMSIPVGPAAPPTGPPASLPRGARPSPSGLARGSKAPWRCAGPTPAPCRATSPATRPCRSPWASTRPGSRSASR